MNKAQVEQRLSEVDKQLDELYDTFGPLLKERSILTKKLKEDQLEHKTGWEKPEWGQTYWYVDELGEVEFKDWKDEKFDEKRYACGNCFTSEKLAENIARYTSLDRRIRRRIAEICEPIDFDGKKNHYYFYFHHADNKFCVNSFCKTQHAMWWCDTEEHAEQIIEEFKDDLLWYFTEFRDRMDV